MSNGPYYAHTPPDHDPNGWQTMRDHSSKVAEMAARFAEPFGASEFARWAGWLHDVGKYSDEFQQYLRDCDAAKKARSKPPPPGTAEHKTAGAKLASDSFASGVRDILSPVVIGHHGGLINNVDIKGRVKDADRRQHLDAAIAVAISDYAALASAKPDPGSLIPLMGGAETQEEREQRFEMLTRFVFSCLVDADSLDTEAHFNKDTAVLRADDSIAQYLDEWLATLSSKQATLMDAASDSPVNSVRSEVYNSCLMAAQSKPGLFNLTVPTGGGKTRSSLAFALEHARVNGMRRVIYSIPYTSIIDQTASVFREILGDSAVLEHHSAIDPRTRQSSGSDDSETSDDVRRRLATENWNAPLIVTTNVQLFESLFANRTGQCRKLHNIAGSVIILDEVQTLPIYLLTPLLDGLRSLIHQFGCSVVLCTATMPAITEDTPVTTGVGKAQQIIDDPAPHFQILKRVRYVVENAPLSWEQVAARMRAESRSCLTVVNTKKDAIALLGELGLSDDIFHLSTLLCGAHRRAKLEEIKRRLAAEREGRGGPIYLASTQVIEAGVDVDFPRAMRAMGPLDRIIQTAGRCNREGRRALLDSEVLVFDPTDGGSPPSEYRTGLEEARRLIRESGGSFDFDSPEVATAYFAGLYKTLQPSYLDRDNVQPARRRRDFPAVASKVKLIADNTIPVLVRYPPMEDLYEAVRREVGWRVKADKPLTRELWRRMQQITVAVYEADARRNATNFDILVPDQLLAWKLPYDDVVGIGGTAAYRDPSDLFG